MQHHLNDIKASITRLKGRRSRHSNPDPQRSKDDDDFFIELNENDPESGRKAVTLMSEIRETQDEAESIDEDGADVHPNDSFDNATYTQAKITDKKSDQDAPVLPSNNQSDL